MYSASTHLSPSYRIFQTFVAKAGLKEEDINPVVFNTYVTNDEQGQDDKSVQLVDPVWPTDSMLPGNKHFRSLSVTPNPKGKETSKTTVFQ